jgi:hypothetical protein
VEALKDDVLVVEVLAVFAVLEPVPGERRLWFGGFAGLNVFEPVVDPGLQEVEVLRTAM